MSDGKRDKLVKDGLDAIVAAANLPPLGIVFHAFVSLPTPIEAGSDFMAAVKKGNAMDVIVNVRTNRRMPRGTYRVAVVLVPEDVATVATGEGSA